MIRPAPNVSGRAQATARRCGPWVRSILGTTGVVPAEVEVGERNSKAVESGTSRCEDDFLTVRLGRMGLFRGLRIKLGLRKPLWPWPGIEIGRCTYGVNEANVFGYEKHNGEVIGYPGSDYLLSIGSYCSVAEGVIFMCRSNHRTEWVSTFPLDRHYAKSDRMLTEYWGKGPTTVGHDVWIGARAMIMSGVTIGNGAVIAAGSIVTKDVPPYAIVAGNPARLVKYRFPPDAVEQFQAIEWWNWPEEKIVSNLQVMTTTPEQFLAAHAPIKRAKPGAKAHP